MTKSFGNVGKAIAATFVATEVIKFGKDVLGSYVGLAREVGGLQRIAGGTAEQVSKLAFAAKESGVNGDVLSVSLRTLSRNLETNSKGARALGLDFHDASGKVKPLADLLPQIADRFKNMPAGVEKTALAVQLFGRSGTQLLPFLNKGSAGIADLSKEAERLGLVMSGKDLASVAKVTRNQREFKAAIEGVKVSLGRDLLPLLTGLATVMVTRVVPAIEKGIGVVETLKRFFDDLPGPAKVVVEALAATAAGGFALSKGIGAAQSVIGGVKDTLSTVTTAYDGLQSVLGITKGSYNILTTAQIREQLAAKTGAASAAVAARANAAVGLSATEAAAAESALAGAATRAAVAAGEGAAAANLLAASQARVAETGAAAAATGGARGIAGRAGAGALGLVGGGAGLAVGAAVGLGVGLNQFRKSDSKFDFTGAQEASHAVKALTADLVAAAPAQNAGAAAWRKYEGAVKSVAPVGVNVAGVLRSVHDPLVSIKTASTAATGAEVPLTAAMRQAGLAASYQKLNMNDLTKAITSNTTHTADAWHTADTYKDALQSAREAIKANGKGLDDNTVKGRANREALLGLVDASHAQIASLIAQRVPAAQLTAVVKSQRAAFISQAAATGISTTAAGKLADQLGLIPKDVTTTIAEKGAAEAAAKVKALADQLALIQSKTITVTANGINNTSGLNRKLQGFATGGDTPVGTFLVGEKGPELLNLPMPGHVTSNKDLLAALANGPKATGSTYNYYATVNTTTGVSVAEVQRAQKLARLQHA